MADIEPFIVGLLMIVFFATGIFIGYNIDKDTIIDDLYNKSQYDFCQLVSKSFKIKKGFYNEN